MGNNKTKTIRTALIIVGMAFTISAFQNCSDVSFDQGSGSASSQSADGANGTIGQPGAPGSGDGADGNIGQGGDPNIPPGGVGGTGPVNNPPGGVTPPGGTVPPGTPTAPAGAIPKVVFIGPPCIRGTNCLVAFELDQAYPMAVDYDWQTNDTIYTTPSTPIYGQPNVHYVPTGGHITFPPGVVRKEVYIQNINPFNIPILIGVRMRNCVYGVPQNCTAFFRP